MKGRKHRIPIVILSVLLAVSLGANAFLYHKYNVEKSRVKNPVAYAISKDYYTYMVQRVKEISQTEERNEEAVFNFGNIVDTPIIAQNPDYPNGCEAASTVMLLNYYGIDVTLDEFVNNYLPKQPVKDVDGVRVGPNPAQYYAGDPADEKRGWGCAAPTIMSSVIDLAVKRGYSVYDLSLTYLDNLACSGILPCVVWTTIDYTETQDVYTWNSEDGKRTYTYPMNSHTVLLVGIEEKFVYINDPLKPEGVQKVDKEQFIRSYDCMGRQAIGLTFE